MVGHHQAGRETRSPHSRFPTASPCPPQLCSRLSTDRLSWLIPVSPECPALLACSRSPARFVGTGPPHGPGDPSPASSTLQGWAGVWPARPSRAPRGGDQGDISIFGVSIMSAAINRAVKITPLCLWAALRCKSRSGLGETGVF